MTLKQYSYFHNNQNLPNRESIFQDSTKFFNSNNYRYPLRTGQGVGALFQSLITSLKPNIQNTIENIKNASKNIGESKTAKRMIDCVKKEGSKAGLKLIAEKLLDKKIDINNISNIKKARKTTPKYDNVRKRRLISTKSRSSSNRKNDINKKRKLKHNTQYSDIFS